MGGDGRGWGTAIDRCITFLSILVCSGDGLLDPNRCGCYCASGYKGDSCQSKYLLKKKF